MVNANQTSIVCCCYTRRPGTELPEEQPDESEETMDLHAAEPATVVVVDSPTQVVPPMPPTNTVDVEHIIKHENTVGIDHILEHERWQPLRGFGNSFPGWCDIQA